MEQNLSFRKFLASITRGSSPVRLTPKKTESGSSMEKPDNIKKLKEQIEYLAGLKDVINVKGKITLTTEDLPKLKSCTNSLILFLTILEME